MTTPLSIKRKVEVDFPTGKLCAASHKNVGAYFCPFLNLGDETLGIECRLLDKELDYGERAVPIKDSKCPAFI